MPYETKTYERSFRKGQKSRLRDCETKSLLITDFGEQIRQTQENKAQPVIAWWLRSR